MDKTGLFYRQLPQYSILVPNEHVSMVRGTNKLILNTLKFLVFSECIKLNIFLYGVSLEEILISNFEGNLCGLN